MKYQRYKVSTNSTYSPSCAAEHPIGTLSSSTFYRWIKRRICLLNLAGIDGNLYEFEWFKSNTGQCLLVIETYGLE